MRGTSNNQIISVSRAFRLFMLYCHFAIPNLLQRTLTIPVRVVSYPEASDLICHPHGRPDCSRGVPVIERVQCSLQMLVFPNSVISVCSTRVSTATCRE